MNIHKGTGRGLQLEVHRLILLHFLNSGHVEWQAFIGIHRAWGKKGSQCNKHLKQACTDGLTVHSALDARPAPMG